MGKLCYLRQPSSVLHAIGIEINQISIKSTMMEYSTRDAFRASSLWSIVSSWIPTASAVRYYTEIQAFERLLWFPLVLSGNLECLLLSLCQFTTLTRSSRSRSLTCWSNSFFDRLRSVERLSCSLIEFILLSCMELRPIVTGSNTLVLLSFSLHFLLSNSAALLSIVSDTNR